MKFLIYLSTSYYLYLIFWSAVLVLFGRFFSNFSLKLITSSVLVVSIISVIGLVYLALQRQMVVVDVTSWIVSDTLIINWGFLYDSLTAIMAFTVIFISAMVIWYSFEYFKQDPFFNKFIALLLLFICFMMFIITAANLVQLLVGWEGVGICSYLLVNFWDTRVQANKAAIKAILVNRLGDFGLVLAIIAAALSFGSIDFVTIFAQLPSIIQSTYQFETGVMVQAGKFGFDLNSIDSLTFISACLFIGAVGKSAQIGLHIWLPDAMEGPTPVSALIHAATMVTAGVFLLARCSFILQYTPKILGIVALIGVTTAFFASTTAVLQNDLKKVIAYSTCSQLGLMVFCCGLSAYHISIFHLMTHAFFKALLFLSAGSIIHALNNEQDIRRMGNLARWLPLTYTLFIIGSLALIGFPFFTGFFSKDAIFEVTKSTGLFVEQIVYNLGCIATVLTAVYSIRLLVYVFLKKPRQFKAIVSMIHEPSWFMQWPLCVLGFGSLLVGYYSKDIFISLTSSFWLKVLPTTPVSLRELEAEFLTWYIKLIPTLCGLTGMGIGIWLYRSSHNLMKIMNLQFFYKLITIKEILLFFNKKWFFDKFVTKLLIIPSFRFGHLVGYVLLDKGLVEFFGPTGGKQIVEDSSLTIRQRATSRLSYYLYTIVVSFILIVLCYCLVLANIVDPVFYFICLLSCSLIPLSPALKKCWELYQEILRGLGRKNNLSR